ncbi:CG14269 [Drosophila busckii]|uniref:CG14269 n=1 Tax=Drosophila busckii TaxID=30019 RepID=A0A0M4EHR8_DROBS|nr:uncharacterized protein LOC108597986 [Drosophila busckii]ALC43288.1 CG14269 [Drosophila busckii]
MQIIDAIFNVALLGACGYGFYALTPADNPYAYTAVAFCFVHALLMLVRSFTDDEEQEDCTRSLAVSTSIADVLPLPLANIEFYSKSSQPGPALVHGMSVILLLYDTMGNLGGDYDSATDTVKDLSVLGNVASAVYCGFNEENYFHVGIGVAAAVARFGAPLIGKFLPELTNSIDTIGKAAIIGLMTYGLTQP